MLFNFQLRPLADVTPWTSDGQPYLHWFGLTDGWYWMNVETVTLFQYTDEVLHQWGESETNGPHRSYVDYQVVRLWEDLLDQLPHILQPIPDNILQRIQPGYEAVLWRNRVIDHLLPDDTDLDSSAFERFVHATEWLDNRRLDAGHLQAGPRIWFWNDGGSVYIHWDNRGLEIDGIPVWTAIQGTFTLPISTFIDEIRSLDERLIKAMQERVTVAQNQWPRPDVRVDISILIREQKERATWLDQTFVGAGQLPQTHWDEFITTYDQWSSFS
ncbi:MAG: DUF5984 family protein [Caldilineaceae bacterium]